jgi:hypothetical protein
VDQFVVGSVNDASSALGVNGNPRDASAPGTGAAAIFSRTNGQWSQTAYLKPLYPYNNNFGINVAIDGKWCCVTSYGGAGAGVSGVNCYRFNGVAWVVDTVVSNAMQPSSRVSWGYFGYGLSLSGSTLAVGCPGESSSLNGIVNLTTNAPQTNSNSGGVYVYTLAPGSLTWNNITTPYLFKAPNAAASDNFGFEVAISGDDLLIGAPYRDKTSVPAAVDAGDAYTAQRSNGVWGFTDQLAPKIQAVTPQNAPGVGDAFGNAVAINGDLIAVGAPFDSSAAAGVNGNAAGGPIPFSGAVYVFMRNPSGLWGLSAYLKASNPDPFDYFGTSVSLSGTTLAVGAPAESSNATGINGNQSDDSAQAAGAVYIFTLGSSWTQQAYLKASNTNTGDLFGWSLSLSGNDLAVGALWEDSAAIGVNGNQADNSAQDSGAVYHFSRNTSNQWAQFAYIKAINTDAGDHFGNHVSLNKGTLAVGAPLEDSAATGINGNRFDNSARDSGAAYVLLLNAGNWQTQAYLKASNTDAGDGFGWRVPLNGDTLAVSAYLEASAADGINGNQADDSQPGAGAAYVFTRSNAVWSQQAYVKASNSVANQLFGFSLDVDGDALYVGAPGESSNATGVNGNANNASSPASGAVFAFNRIGSSWSQFAYIKAPINTRNDQFGRSFDTNLGTMVIGEDSSSLQPDFTPNPDSDGDAHTFRFAP